MDDETKPFGQLTETILTAAAASPEPSMRGSTGSVEHKRAFLEMFRRWEVLFKRKDSGDTQADKWLIAEYYDSLGHLSVEGMSTLTRMLKEHCTFFPSVKECLDLMRPKDRYDWGHPFLSVHNGRPSPLLASAPSPRALAMQSAPRLTDERGEPPH